MKELVPLPDSPTAKFMKWKLMSFDSEAGRVRISFEPRPEFTNPSGYVQGGFLAAMLDDCTGPGVWLQSEGKLYTVTIGLNISFIAPVPCAPLMGEGQIIQLGKTIGFVDARLMDLSERTLVKASATVRLVQTERLRSPSGS